MSKPTFSYEQTLWQKGYRYVVGIDEVGRGAFAGPLVVGAVVFPRFCGLNCGINDSKLVSVAKREALTPIIKKAAVTHAIAEIPVSVINRVGIGKASQVGFRKVIKLLSLVPDFILIDAFYIKHVQKGKQHPIVKGDQKSISIAAASIIAKVYRDNLMKKLHSRYTAYNFCNNVGYGTVKHRIAIAQFGLTKLHRTSFKIIY